MRGLRSASMGDSLSKPSEPNPSSAAASNHAMTSSISSENPQPESLTPPVLPSEIPESESPVQESKESPDEKGALPVEILEDPNGKEEDNEEEEQGECGFCLFMKAGGCKDTFTDWENCVEESEKNKEDIVEKCFQATAALKKCMEAHSDYYAPLLEAEKAAEAEASRQLEEEKEKKRSNNDVDESGKKEKEENLDVSEKKLTS